MTAIKQKGSTNSLKVEQGSTNFDWAKQKKECAGLRKSLIAYAACDYLSMFYVRLD